VEAIGFGAELLETIINNQQALHGRNSSFEDEENGKEDDVVGLKN
jgi:hypothetical protein